MKFPSTLWLLAFHFLLFAINSYASPIQLPRTGQKTCYDTAGALISCMGTGQDGDIQAGIDWPSPRFVDNGDQTVTDKLTGLVWTKDSNLMVTRDPDFDTDNTANDGVVTWQHALNYIKKLNQEAYLGFSDWRLPNGYELESLVDTGSYYPALQAGNPFLNTQGKIYWTSSTLTSHPVNAWTVTVGGAGRFFGFSKSDYFFTYVWPMRTGIDGVRVLKTGQTKCYDKDGIEINCAGTGQDGDIQSGIIPPNPRFTDNNNGTVTDTASGLFWAKDANLIVARNPSFDGDGTIGDGLVTWQHSLDYVAKLNQEHYLGFSDWRLPNINELASLADLSNVNPSLPSGHPFANVQQSNSGGYWSSSTNSDTPSEGWVVAMQAGGIRSGVSKTSYYSFWPVRGTSLMAVTPSSMDFGTVTTGSIISPLTLTVSNSPQAQGSLTVDSTVIYGSDSGQFAIDPGDGSDGTCGSLTPVISPGSSCTITVSFNPTVAGNKNANLRISSDNPNSPVQLLPLTGIVVNPAYLVTFSAGSNGSVSGAASQTVNFGANTTPVTAVPITGYHFVNWTSPDGFTSTANPLTLMGVNAEQTITANFAVDTFTVTTSAGSNGSFYPSEPRTVNFNESTSFTVTPNAGHYLVSISGCGGSLSGSTYTTAAATNNCMITATFEPVPDGDLDGAGITISDALRSLKLALGIMAPSQADLIHGDVAPLVNGKPQPDGKIDIRDVVVTLRKAVGLVTW